MTSLAHGGGCGCKLAPSVLRQLLRITRRHAISSNSWSGPKPATTRRCWQLDNSTCMIATTDFFMPMVDDPFDFGRIAATNAISDIYAMGAADHGAGNPRNAGGQNSRRNGARNSEGGASICEAGIPVAGGHSIDSPEPIYGLAVIGIGRPEDIRRNSGANRATSSS